MPESPRGYSRCSECETRNSDKRQFCHKCKTLLPHWYSNDFSAVEPLPPRSKLEQFREFLASFPVWQPHRDIGLWAMLGLLVASWLIVAVPGVKGWLEQQTGEYRDNPSQ